MDEFDLIRRYFEPLQRACGGIKVGIGDDAAVVGWDAAEPVAIAVDTLVEGIHFPADMPADALGFRAVAVNLSDFAAMGAQPRYATLALTLPRAEGDWLEAFARGLGEALEEADTVLVGGDTTRGPLTVTVQIIGASDGAPMTRGGARPDDVILVSGTLGDARAGLDLIDPDTPSSNAGAHELIRRFMRPEPRLQLGRACRSHVHAAIDVSDGLLADLGHVMAASGCRAEIELERLPLSTALLAAVGRERALQYAATGGDDYELVLCVPPAAGDGVIRIAERVGVPLTPVGRVHGGAGVVCLDQDGRDVTPRDQGYVHFE